MSNQTKKTKKRYLSLLIFSLILNIVPIAVTVCICFKPSNSKNNVAPLVFCLLLTSVLGIVHLLSKTSFNSFTWILLIGAVVAINNSDKLIKCLVAIGTCNVIDDLIVNPIKLYYKERYKINKEIDSRIGE